MVVFAPHPDDETFGCGGTIVKRLKEGFGVFIVILTDGRHAFLNVLGMEHDPTPEELRIIRKEEVIKAASILGVPKENLFFFDYEDGALEEHETEAEGKIIEMLKELGPSEVYFPLGGDANVDHQTASRIVKRSIEKSGLEPSRYQYSISERFSRFAPPARRLLSLLKHNIVYVDISEEFQTKKAAVRVFKSEIEALSARQRRPIIENFEKFLKNKEIFYSS